MRPFMQLAKVVSAHIAAPASHAALILLIFVLAIQPVAATFIVSANAGGNGSGTSTSPWSVSQALQNLPPGDTALFLPGTYEPFKITRSGTENIPLCFMAAKGNEHKAIVTRNDHTKSQGIKADNADYLLIEGFAVDKVNQGIYVYKSDYVVVKNCKVTNIGQEALRFKYSNYGSFINNIVDNAGLNTNANNGEGIYVGSGDVAANEEDPTHHVLVRGNHISRTMDEGIELKPGTYECIVENNIVHDLTIKDGGGINVQAARIDKKFPNHIVRNNIAYKVFTRTQWMDGNGIRAGRGCAVYNNICYDNQHCGIRIDDKAATGEKIKVYHNTLAGNGSGPVKIFDNANADIKNNIGPSQAGNLAFAASLFVNAGGHDYHLAQGSAAIDAGSDVGIKHDLDGNARPNGSASDIGAYEFSSPSNKAIQGHSFKYEKSNSQFYSIRGQQLDIYAAGARMRSKKAFGAAVEKEGKSIRLQVISK